VRKPVIGVISVSRPFETSYFGQVYKSYVVEEYTDVLKGVGAVPVVLTQVGNEDVNAQLDLVDGILIVGGADVDPKFYGEAKHEKIGYTNELDDIYHISMIKEVERRDLPFIGICRGYQVFNVAMGGSLYQDVPTMLNMDNVHEQKEAKSIPTHYVNTVKGTKLQDLIGEKAFVNSFHHQAVKTIGSNLQVAAFSEGDDIIEAIEHKKAEFMVGVQWHPEQLIKSSNTMLPLFEEFVGVAKNQISKKTT